MEHFKQLSGGRKIRLPRAASTRSDARAIVAGDATIDAAVSTYSFYSLFFPFFHFVSFSRYGRPKSAVSLDTHTYTLGEIGTRLFGHASCRNVYMISALCIQVR